MYDYRRLYCSEGCVDDLDERVGEGERLEEERESTIGGGTMTITTVSIV